MTNTIDSPQVTLRSPSPTVAYRQQLLPLDCEQGYFYIIFQWVKS